jgi:hypothetical protein
MKAISGHVTNKVELIERDGRFQLSANLPSKEIKFLLLVIILWQIPGLWQAIQSAQALLTGQ